jgi:carbon starvation protein CstA
VAVVAALLVTRFGLRLPLTVPSVALAVLAATLLVPAWDRWGALTLLPMAFVTWVVALARSAKRPR